MRLTCLKCGHQIELATAAPAMRISCVCGRDYTYPDVVNTGTQPNEKAAERLRYRAFRAAGLVQNVGGFALGIALLGIIFPPFAIVGAGIGVYVLTMLRGPVGRYSGRPQAMAAVGIGVVAFLGVGGIWLNIYQSRQHQKLVVMQEGAREDLKRLLRAERIYKATNDRFGGFSDFKFQPTWGQYTFYLGPGDIFRGEENVAAELPADLSPGFSEDAFMAVAVANLDDDSDLDVWIVSEADGVQHLRDDLEGTGLPLSTPRAPAPIEPSGESGPAAASGPRVEPSGAAPQGAVAPAPAPVPAAAPAPTGEAKPAAPPAPTPPVEAAAPAPAEPAEAPPAAPPADAIPAPEPE